MKHLEAAQGNKDEKLPHIPLLIQMRRDLQTICAPPSIYGPYHPRCGSLLFNTGACMPK